MSAVDLCLVSMPGHHLHFPPAGIGALVATAKRAGLNAKALHPSFWFAERVGTAAYALTSAFTPFLLGELTFASAAFGEAARAYEPALREQLARQGGITQQLKTILGEGKDLLATVAALRRAAEEFVPEAAARVMAHSPKVVGCSSNFQQHCGSLALLREIKRTHPNVVTVIGGYNCDGAMGAATARLFPWVDYVFVGEADLTLPALCDRLARGERPSAPSELPQGVIASAAPPADQAAAPALVKDLDRLPTPDHDDYFEALAAFTHRRAVVPCIVAETARGCWWGEKHPCSFCGVERTRMCFRSKSAPRARAELDELQAKYGVDRFLMADLILDHRYFASLLPALGEGEGPTRHITYETKAQLTEQQVRTLAQAGVRKIQPGVESLHDEVLRLLNKGVSAIQNVALLKYNSEQGVHTLWNMLFDIPGADDGWFGEIADLIPLVTHLQPPVGFTPIQFNRFSEYHREPERHGLRLVPEAMYAFAYPVKATDLTELAYYFADHNRDAATAWRPGLARLATAVREWQALARDSAETHRVTLTACDQDGALVIDDTRPCAVAPRTVLSGLASTVYRRCHKPTAFADLLAHLQNDGPLSPSEAEVRAAVDDLSLRRLLLACSGKLLSLALRAPVRPFLPKRRYLFGTQVQPRLLV